MKTKRSRRPVVASALAAMLLVAAACGDDDTADDASATTDSGGSAATTGAPGGDEPPASTATGDGGGPDGTTATSEGSGGADVSCPADRVGGQLTAVTGAAATGLDPAMMQGSGARGGDIAGAFYGTVIRYDPETDTYHPYIAESWEANDDNTEWTLTLRDDVTFGNGDPFTTEDIAAHLERMAGTSVRAAGMAALVENVEIVSDHEMVVTLSSPADFRYMMASEPGWVPNNDIVQERGDDFNTNAAGAGAGPFAFESMAVTPGESLVLSAKDDWWGGTVCLDSIDFQYIGETATQTDALAQEEIDTLLVGDQTQAAELDEQGLMEYQIPVGALGYITMNQGFQGQETKFDDVRIRRAMQLAIDYDVLYQRLFNGVGPAPTSALVPEESALYTGVDGPPYDPEQARQLVQETIDDGVWDGSFTFLHPSFSQEQRDLGVLLEGMWEGVGMDVTREAGEDTAVRVIVEHNFEVATLGFGIVPPQPWTTLNGLECESPRTRSGFCDPDMDAALASVREAVGLDEQREAIAEVQEVWNETIPLLVYRHGTFGYAAQPYVKGLEFGVDYTPYFDEVWLDR